MIVVPGRLKLLAAIIKLVYLILVVLIEPPPEQLQLFKLFGNAAVLVAPVRTLLQLAQLLDFGSALLQPVDLGLRTDQLITAGGVIGLSRTDTSAISS